MKNNLAYIVCTCTILASCANDGFSADALLPEGSAPAPIVTRYFPDRMHEFVWRNWNAVEPATLAKILGTSVENVIAIAASMGLPPVAEIPKEMRTRGYITLIRRNWHLLPYSQLLELLEMTPEHLAATLREDDFLFIKLGSLKPKCQPLHYTVPDEAAQRHAAEIKRVVETEFGDEIRQTAEARFRFVQKLSTPMPGSVALAAAAGDDSQLSLRYIYSYFAVFGDPLLNPELDPYPEGLLQRLSALGINGVWLHVVLRDMAPGGAMFPEFGKDHEKRLANLRVLVERAKKYGIRIYLYMNEPRMMPNAFFKVKERSEIAGVTAGDFTALCTSHPAVRQWLGDALTYVFKTVPDLGGIFTITASENMTNCASHGLWKSCSKCKNRSDAEIIAEVNSVMEQAVHRGNPAAKVIAWDWGWRGHGDAPDIIAQLPKSVWLMSVSEWALPVERGGVHTSVGEYSMSVVGPGPRATRHWKLAKEAGLKTAAKMQLNNTWELSSVPYLPVMDLVAQHCHNLASAGVDGMMLSWSLGGYPSPNLEIAAQFCAKKTPTVADVLNDVASRRFGTGASEAREAWSAFSAAFSQFPYGCAIYNFPGQMGPANPLYAEKTGYHATMVGLPYDDLASWHGAYPIEAFVSQFEKVAEGWKAGIPHLQSAVKKTPADRRTDAEAELQVAEAAYTHFQSVVNQTRFIVARDALAADKSSRSPQEQADLRKEMRRCLESEIALARRLFTLTSQDSRIGFEASNHYFYLPLDLAEKVINCRWLLHHIEENE
jgi:hypothetical protein